MFPLRLLPFIACLMILSISTAQAAENDTCETAIALSASAGFCLQPIAGVDFIDAVNESQGECTFGGGGTALDLWYSVEVPSSGSLIVETNGSWDSVLEALAGDCSNLQSIECDDDGGFGTLSLISLINREPGEIIYIRVWEYLSDSNPEWTICAYDPDSSCTDDIGLSVETQCIDEESFEVLISLENLAEGQTYTIQDLDGNIITESDQPEYLWGPIDNGVALNFSVITDTEVGICGEIFESISKVCSGPPANDNCIDAIEIVPDIGGDCYNPVDGTFLASATQESIGFCDVGTGDPVDVWYKTTVPETGLVNIITSGEMITSMEVMTGSDCSSLSNVECNGNGYGTTFIDLEDLNPGDLLFIRVWDFNFLTFDPWTICIFDPTLTCTVPNVTTAPQCDEENEGQYTAVVTIEGMAEDEEYHIEDDFDTAPSATITEDGTYFYGNYPVDTQVSILLINDTNSACNTEPQSIIEYCLPSPANDNCLDAITLVPDLSETCENPVDGDGILGATQGEQLGVCNIGVFENYVRDVWYRVEVPSTGQISLETGGSLDTVMEVLAGSDCDNLTPVECDDDAGEGSLSLLNLSGLTPGEMLYVRIWEYGNDLNGAWTICSWSTPPPCEPSAASYETECIAGANFQILINIDTLGTAQTYIIEDDFGTNPIEGTNQLGQFSYGTYPSGSEVVITFIDPDTEACNSFSETITAECFLGGSCEDSFPLDEFPFQELGATTAIFPSQGYNIPCNDGIALDQTQKVYSYTPPANTCLNMAASNTSQWAGLFVLDACPSDPSAQCIGYTLQPGGNPILPSVDLNEGTTYYIIVATTETIAETDFEIQVSTCDGFNVATQELEFVNASLAPNPINDQAILAFSPKHTDQYTVDLIALDGSIVPLFSNRDFVEGQHYDLAIEVEDFPAGMYFLKISDSQANSHAIKIMIAE